MKDMEPMDFPVFKKSYELYRVFHDLRKNVPKADRYSLWQTIEQTTLQIIEHLLLAGQRKPGEKKTALEQASMQLNLLRILVRLAKDTKVIDLKKYAVIQQIIDEIGKMLGGWLKSDNSVQAVRPPQQHLSE